jgi:sterol desaturase/sphingolipid hydroxylase (fatty acid hydroxylase superfamily)
MLINIFYWSWVSIINYFIINLCYYWYHRFLHNPKSGILYKLHYLGHHKKDFPLRAIRKNSYSGDGTTGWFKTGGEFVFGIPIIILLWIINKYSTYEYFSNFMVILIGVVLIGEICHSSFHLTKNAISHPESIKIHKYIVNSNWYPFFMNLHDIHHGRINYNFGFINMSMDKIFGTYSEIKPKYFTTLKLH